MTQEKWFLMLGNKWDGLGTSVVVKSVGGKLFMIYWFGFWYKYWLVNYLLGHKDPWQIMLGADVGSVWIMVIGKQINQLDKWMWKIVGHIWFDGDCYSLILKDYFVLIFVNVLGQIQPQSQLHNTTEWCLLIYCEFRWHQFQSH